MGNERIKHALLTAAWMSTDAALMDNGGAGDQPLALLGAEEQYAARFQQAQVNLKTGQWDSLTPPWRRQKGQNFWQHYLKKPVQASVDGSLAWKKNTPLRVQVPLLIAVALPHHPNLILNGDVEGFLYPHAVAALVTLSWSLETSVPGFEELALVLRRDPVYSVQWQPGPAGDIFQNAQWPSASGAKISLGAIGLRLLRLLRSAVFGPGAAEGGKLTNSNPFTILSVLGGEGVDLTQKPADNGEIQRMLHAVTAWEKVPKGAAPLKLDSEVMLELGQLAGPADLMYSARRGRAVWYPSKFMQKEQPNFKLACYHRNLMFASLQTEALYGYAVELAERRAANKALSLAFNTLARRNGATLGLIYGAHPDTYRSQSPRRQIDDNLWVGTINAMRWYVGMQPLS